MAMRSPLRVPALFCALPIALACARWFPYDSWGDLVVINTDASAHHFALDHEPPKTIPAKQHHTFVGIPSGEHRLTDENGTAVSATVRRGKTTAYDIAGTGCYVVGDFGNQYQPASKGEVVIVERFKQQRLFTTSVSLLIPYGEPLPKEISEGVHVRSLLAVDCAAIDNESEILAQIRRTP